jgi:hypothetical protein
VSPSIHAFLIAYGLLIGPGACLGITVVPSVLVTRWFAVDRGRALGILHMPILSMITPLIVVRLLDQYGLPTDYLFLTALVATVIAAAVFIVDRPPADYRPSVHGGRGAIPSVQNRRGLLAIVRWPVFWTLSLSTTCVLASGIMLGTHLVPMVTQWGITHTQAATLVSVGSLASILGAVFFGWLADKVGGARTIMLICVLCIAMWGFMLLHPAFPALIGLIALTGVNVAGVVPAFGFHTHAVQDCSERRLWIRLWRRQLHFHGAVTVDGAARRCHLCENGRLQPCHLSARGHFGGRDAARVVGQRGAQPGTIRRCLALHESAGESVLPRCQLSPSCGRVDPPRAR